MEYAVQRTLVVLILLLAFSSIQAQTAEMVMPQEHSLIPGQIVVYLQDDVTPAQAKKNFLDLNLDILKTDIKPVFIFLSNPDKTVIEQIESHPSIEKYEIHTFVYDSTTLKDLKLADGMTEEEKEQARKRFLEQEDWTTMGVSFRYRVTKQEAETILTSIAGIGEYDLKSYPRIVYIEVETGTEPEQMEKLQSLPFVTDVARVALTVATKQ